MRAGSAPRFTARPLSSGISLMTEDELNQTAGLAKLPAIDRRARDVDAYYGGKVLGFRAPGATGGAGLLTFAGLYTGLYRISSRSQHAAIDGADPCIDATGYPWR